MHTTARLDSAFETAWDRTVKTVTSYEETGELRDETIEELGENHLMYPSRFSDFVFGTARLVSAPEAVVPEGRSDIGYVIVLFGLGALGSLIVLTFYLLVLHRAWVSRRVAAPLAVLSFWLTVGLLLGHAKEQILFTRYYFSVTSLLIIALAHREEGARLNSRMGHPVSRRHAVRLSRSTGGSSTFGSRG
jgi:hypothetical protein